MRRCVFLFGLMAVAVVAAGAARAEVSIEQLIVEAKLAEGPVAARELKSWRTPKKIVVRDVLGLTERLQADYPDTQIIGVDTSDGAAAQAAGADAIVGFCHDDIVAAADDLVWIQIFGAGSERCLAVDKVGNGEILLTNMQKMSSPVIGEHAVAMMMSLTRGLVPYAKVMRDGAWQRGLTERAGMTSLAGAGLDVTQPEPLPADHPLWQMDNVIITPHVAGSGSEWERHGVLVKENVRRFIAGDKLLNVVDPDKGY